jgi:hypothetical protein
VAIAVVTWLSAAQAPADQLAARTDENSRIAHTQLIEKPRGGRIDVYFAGESITRLWGATELLGPPGAVAHAPPPTGDPSR